MPTSNSCPTCAVLFRLTDKMRGRKMRCPNCGQALLFTRDGNLKQDGPHPAAAGIAPPAHRGWLILLVLVGSLALLGGAAALILFALSDGKPAGQQQASTKGDGQELGVAKDPDLRQGSSATKDPELRQDPSAKKAPNLQDKLHLLPPDAVTPVITYFFNDNFHPEEQGVPDLVPTDPLGGNGFEDAQVLGLRKRIYRFTGKALPVDQQAGLTFDNRKGLLPSNTYSVEIVLMFLQGDGSWRRIVDVQDRQSDDGFYADPNNHLQVYPLPGIGKLITAGGYHHVVLTVEKTGTVKAYLDGSIQFTGSTQVMVINNPRRVVHFFLDNTVGPGQGEFSNGKVALIRLYNRVLSDQKVSQLADWVRGTKSGSADVPADKDVPPDPGSLVGLQNQVGKTFSYRVTGSTTGSIYGTDVYTADSTLATAAVHAGVLRPGETQVVRVQMVAGLSNYTGSTRNGVTSIKWGAYPAAYTITRGGAIPRVQP